jgi:hypothetical protein
VMVAAARETESAAEANGLLPVTKPAGTFALETNEVIRAMGGGRSFVVIAADVIALMGTMGDLARARARARALLPWRLLKPANSLNMRLQRTEKRRRRRKRSRLMCSPMDVRAPQRACIGLRKMQRMQSSDSTSWVINRQGVLSETF